MGVVFLAREVDGLFSGDAAAAGDLPEAFGGECGETTFFLFGLHKRGPLQSNKIRGGAMRIAGDFAGARRVKTLQVALRIA
ncbi:MAG TPA: hypothetical protein VHQ47_18610 [Phycisphaerae bacterium]|nr:hypothetical protein [Phycisphaerae bacterium]